MLVFLSYQGKNNEQWSGSSDMTDGHLRHDVITEAKLDGGHADVTAALESWRPCIIRDSHKPNLVCTRVREVNNNNT